MKNIADFKNCHEGKRLFILASGTSLNDLDLSPLKRRLVMGLNRSFLIFPETYYHCAMDFRLFEEFHTDLKNTRCLLTLEGRPLGTPIKLLGAEGFSRDLGKGIYSGYTIAYIALQIAVYMGFKEIFFLGLDLKNDGRSTHFFGHDYHSKNHETTEFPKMKKMLEFGAQTLSNTNVKVFNCSPVSQLEGFSKVSYEYAISL